MTRYHASGGTGQDCVKDKLACVATNMGVASAPDAHKLCKTKRTPQSKAVKAGLRLPATRITRKLKEHEPKCKAVSPQAAIYATAVIEYLLAEVLELASEKATGSAAETGSAPRKRVQPEDIRHAIRNDTELARLFSGVRFVLGDRMSSAHVADAVTCEWDKKAKAAQKASTA